MSYISVENLQSLKIKNVLYFTKWNFLASRFKSAQYFMSWLELFLSESLEETSLSSIINFFSHFFSEHIYIFLKASEGNNLFYKLNQSILVIDKYIDILPLLFYIWENLCWFSMKDFFLVFTYFPLYTELLSNYFLIMLLTVFHISLYFIKKTKI